ncbi:MAG: hypothetical protein KDK51_08815, partial [Deltaproteobacteria bacterium]|nr:hypothetical protein [Deltaproteobacteria bacterium]
AHAMSKICWFLFLMDKKNPEFIPIQFPEFVQDQNMIQSLHINQDVYRMFLHNVLTIFANTKPTKNFIQQDIPAAVRTFLNNYLSLKKDELTDMQSYFDLSDSQNLYELSHLIFRAKGPTQIQAQHLVQLAKKHQTDPGPGSALLKTKIKDYLQKISYGKNYKNCCAQEYKDLVDLSYMPRKEYIALIQKHNQDVRLGIIVAPLIYSKLTYERVILSNLNISEILVRNPIKLYIERYTDSQIAKLIDELYIGTEARQSAAYAPSKKIYYSGLKRQIRIFNNPDIPLHKMQKNDNEETYHLVEVGKAERFIIHDKQTFNQGYRTWGRVWGWPTDPEQYHDFVSWEDLTGVTSEKPSNTNQRWNLFKEKISTYYNETDTPTAIIDIRTYMTVWRTYGTTRDWPNHPLKDKPTEMDNTQAWNEIKALIPSDN